MTNSVDDKLCRPIQSVARLNGPAEAEGHGEEGDKGAEEVLDSDDDTDVGHSKKKTKNPKKPPPRFFFWETQGGQRCIGCVFVRSVYYLNFQGHCLGPLPFRIRQCLCPCLCLQPRPLLSKCFPLLCCPLCLLYYMCLLRSCGREAWGKQLGRGCFAAASAGLGGGAALAATCAAGGLLLLQNPFVIDQVEPAPQVQHLSSHGAQYRAEDQGYMTAYQYN